MVCGDFREWRGGNGARCSRLSEDYFAGVRKQDAGDFIHGFVAQRCKNDDQFPSAQSLCKKGSQFTRGGGIVCTVEVNVRMRVDFFDAARPDCSCDALLDGVVGDLEFLRLQDTSGCDCVQSVLQLKAASQLRVELVFISAGDFFYQRADPTVGHLLRFDRKGSLGLDYRCVEFARLCEKNFASFVALLGGDYGNAGFDDSGFFGGNFTQRMAEEVFVVEIDTSDDADPRRKNVGCIEAATKSSFENCELHFLLSEIDESDSGNALEKSRVRS